MGERTQSASLPLQGLEGIMIRCVGAALRGDGNPPEVPVIRTVLRAYNGVWGIPIKHECRTLCAQMPCLPNDFAKQSIVKAISPEAHL